MYVWSAWKWVRSTRSIDATDMPARGSSACTGAPQSMSTRSSTRYAALQPHPLKASPLPTTVSRVLAGAASSMR